MRRSFPRSNPVITFVSGSSSANQRAQQAFCSLLKFQEVTSLNHYTFSDHITSSSLVHTQSVAAQCPTSGTILHFLSLEPKFSIHADDATNNKSNTLSLLAITNAATSIPKSTSTSTLTSTSTFTTDNLQSIQKAREQISTYIKPMTALALKVGMLNLMDRPLISTDILKKSQPIPHVDTDTFHAELHSQQDDYPKPIMNHLPSDSSCLREIVIPYADDDDNDNENINTINSTSLLSKLNTTFFQRPIDPMTQKPVIGLFQWPKSSVHLRPLPTAEEDRVLPPPSLVFQCHALHDMEHQILEQQQQEKEENSNRVSGVNFAKVGFTGAAGTHHKGQLMVRHDDFMGLDIRLCEAKHLSSSFAGAQDALLAGSLDDLQSRNVLVEGGQVRVTKTPAANTTTDHTNTTSKDSMNGLGDCWVEFRANMKAPAGFFKRGKIASTNLGKKPSPNRIAKAPDLPYE